MMKKIMLFLSIIVFCSASENEFTLIKKISFDKATGLSTDQLGYAYVIVQNELVKLDKTGKLVATSSEKNLGTLQQVDVTNPLKTLLFYPDFARILILDSKLSLQSEIDLRSIQINQPLAACSSDEQGYWVYDREDDQLKKLDFNLQVIFQSGNLTQITGYQLQPQMMLEENGFVYINNPETGIVVFDRYGTYFKTIPYKNLDTFQVINGEILFMIDKKLLRYNSKTVSESEVLIPPCDSLHTARIEQNELYLLTNDSLKFYSF